MDRATRSVQAEETEQEQEQGTLSECEGAEERGSGVQGHARSGSLGGERHAKGAACERELDRA